MATDRIGALSLGPLVGRLRAIRTGPARAALQVFAIRIASAGFAYIAQVLMARLLGGTEYGIFAAVWVWIGILGHSATLGLSQGACRFLPAEQAQGRNDAVRGFLIGGAVAAILGALLLAAAGLLILRAEGALLAGPYGAPILLAAAILPLFALQDFCEGVARSQNWAILAIAPPYLLRQGLIMVAMVAAVWFGAPAEAWVAVACTLLATAVAVGLQAGWLILRLRTVCPAGPRTYRWRRWLRACLPIALTDLAGAGFNVVDVVILSALMPPATVGLYFAATRIQQFVVFVHFAASAATAQRFTAIHAAGDRAGLTDLVRMQANLTLAATIVIGAGVLVAAPLLLGLFGPDFRDSLPILAVLVAGSIAASVFGPGEDLLTMLGGEGVCAAITLATLGLAAGLCWTLIPAYGVIGAALAMAVAAAMRGLAMALAVRAIHGLVTPVRFGSFRRTVP
ncbi:lipopolysaccharide biosynthesis protein [Methylobacterium sp. J-090]|uniref:lipopolysaccharide biosynthesis protein n=1 Tax=Methylobacterium sp. J-090 TaxID=2836666 RepID=UPI001FB9A3B8|nr:oligosaccharide flippase family protein [Methylobacterium sp. J-090]MCJ2083021.1 oligosaccharide flippase family protein [Methylobacterium sp. J-090]